MYTSQQRISHNILPCSFDTNLTRVESCEVNPMNLLFKARAGVYNVSTSYHSSQAKAMSKVKKNDNAKKATETTSVESSQVAEPDEKVRVRTFKSHDLSELPEEALPFHDGFYKGAHSYTVTVEGAAPWIKPVKKAVQIFYLLI